jgi:hypothetical protein
MDLARAVQAQARCRKTGVSRRGQRPSTSVQMRCDGFPLGFKAKAAPCPDCPSKPATSRSLPWAAPTSIGIEADVRRGKQQD